MVRAATFIVARANFAAARQNGPMSYLVLARKWRPKRFAELVGQEHVVRALTNALDSGRVHHAFLFTGTRGVGKTTIARIFAKSLNCERGTSAEPCGECNACRDIDAGRFIDLLEIDAASNTGVDNVRELIENAQYMPSRGRYKVYLIDEVHMLSKPAFNALLKTLEEPPGHVKFLLATTDPQKLPVTVLSRCLQFNLKRLDEEQIGGPDRDDPRRPKASTSKPARSGSWPRPPTAACATACRCSTRRSPIPAQQRRRPRSRMPRWRTMLGTVDRSRVDALLAALAAGDGAALLAEVAHARRVFAGLERRARCASPTPCIACRCKQLVPDVAIEADGIDVDALAAQLRPEVVQLWYQMALNGASRPVAGAQRARGLRDGDAADAGVPSSRGRHAASRADAARTASAAAAAKAALAVRQPSRRRSRARRPQRQPAAASDASPPAARRVPRATRRRTAPSKVREPQPRRPVDSMPTAGSNWSPAAALRGPARELAAHAGFVGYDDGVLRLSLSRCRRAPQGAEPGRAAGRMRSRRRSAHVPQIRFESAQAASETPAPAQRARARRAPGRGGSRVHGRPRRAAADQPARRHAWCPIPSDPFD